MRFSQSAFVFTFLAAAAAPGVVSFAQDLVAKTEARTPDEERKALRVPPGFEIQLVAAEPDIRKPMNIAFDSRGRLWVTDTIEYPYPAAQGREPRDAVKVLEDFGPDGRARKVTTFADKLNIPIGVLPIDAADGKTTALVYAIPDVFRFRDGDGDGQADRRDVVLGTYGFRDTHGMTNSFTVGFDGWVYACHGFANDSEVKARDGSVVKMNSGNVYRFKPDGSRVEWFSRGQVNPFGLCFDPFGNLYSADCHSRPQYLLLRGAYYPSFGKPHDGLGFGPEMILHDHGSTGIAGSLYYDAAHFPQAYRGTIFNGNPVTGRINHDKLEWHGSSPKAVEQPDFVVSDDPWFRPVDIKLGPDGAMYVADFYNRIIGHYEVPLEHPGRDRDRGRIWRIVYRGADGKAPVNKVPDFTAMAPDALVAALGDENLTVRMLATNVLEQRLRDAATAARIASALDRAQSPRQAVQALWLLHRGGLATPEQIGTAASHGDAVVRTHAMRVLSETASSQWTPRYRDLALAGLRDKDGHVQRAAADALGRHPDAENVRPLLALRGGVPRADTHLLHTARMALRNQLQAKGALAQLAGANLGEAEERAVADVALGVDSPEVGDFLVRHVGKYGGGDKTLVGQYLRHAARYVSEKQLDALVDLLTGRFAEDVDFQAALYRSVQEGTAQRGAAPTAAIVRWGGALAERLLASVEPWADTWVRTPLPNRPGARRATAPSPWFIQSRPSAGSGQPVPFWSSLPPGGEELTGVLRSQPFDVPARLTFYLAGHNGPPGKDGPAKNFVRLLDAKTGEVLAEALPPRNDVAQKVTWDLSKFAGRKAVFEATDGYSADGYAWLAFGRFDPPVLKLPTIGPDVIRQRQQTAAEIAGALRLTTLEQRLATLMANSAVDPEPRAAAGRALAAISPDKHVKELGRVAADPNVPPALRDAVSQALGELNTPAGRAELAAALAVAPTPLQRTLALALARTTAGAEELLAAVQAGKASPRLLLEPPVRERLNAARPADLEKRVAQLTRGLPPVSEESQKMLEERRAGYDAAAASAERGAKVFATNCGICHKVKNEGATVGPQLDGVGQRGLERLVEDVLDPNRNVDAAFRQTIVQLEGGDSVAGLVRREEGELLVLADAQGKEFTVPKARIRRQAPSALSPMPSNFGEILPPQDFNDLVAFLLAN